MENSYATALWKAVESGMSPKEAVAGLIKTLEVRGRIALVPKILRAFKRLSDRAGTQHAYTLALPREHDEKSRKAALASLASQGEKNADIVIQHDDTLIGGWRLEGKGKLIDASYKKHLLDLYNKVTS